MFSLTSRKHLDAQPDLQEAWSVNYIIGPHKGKIPFMGILDSSQDPWPQAASRWWGSHPRTAQWSSIRCSAHSSCLGNLCGLQIILLDHTYETQSRSKLTPAVLIWIETFSQVVVGILQTDTCGSGLGFWEWGSVPPCFHRSDSVHLCTSASIA